MVAEPEVLPRMLEEQIDPELPICDPHHHLWDRPAREDRPRSRYLLDELLEDIGGGHNIVKTVFVECRSMYCESGPEEMRPVGETEFVQGIAAQSASGQYGPTRVAAAMPNASPGRIATRVTLIKTLAAASSAVPTRPMIQKVMT